MRKAMMMVMMVMMVMVGCKKSNKECVVYGNLGSSTVNISIFAVRKDCVLVTGRADYQVKDSFEIRIPVGSEIDLETKDIAGFERRSWYTIPDVDRVDIRELKVSEVICSGWERKPTYEIVINSSTSIVSLGKIIDRNGEVTNIDKNYSQSPIRLYLDADSTIDLVFTSSNEMNGEINYKYQDFVKSLSKRVGNTITIHLEPYKGELR